MALGVAAALVGFTPAVTAQSARSGYVLVANQQSASASLIDLRTDSMRFIPVGVGPHEAIVSSSGRVGVVTVYGQQPPGNELAIIDRSTGTVKKRISLGEYVRPHGAMFMPRNESRVVVTSEATQKLVPVNIETGTVEGTVSTAAAGSHMVGVTADGTRAFTSNIFRGVGVGAGPGEAGAGEGDPGGSSRGGDRGRAGRQYGVGGEQHERHRECDRREEWQDDRDVRRLLPSLPSRDLGRRQDGDRVRSAGRCDPCGGRGDAKGAVEAVRVGLAEGVAIAPDGKTAFVTLAEGPAVGIVDLVGRKLLRKVGVGASPDGVAFGPSQ